MARDATERGMKLVQVEMPLPLYDRMVKASRFRGISEFVRAACADAVTRRSHEQIREQARALKPGAKRATLEWVLGIRKKL